MHIGLIGGGNITATHARAARACGLEIAAIYGENAERVAALAHEHAAVPYADLERFLAHRPMELVAIGSPSGLHADQGIAAARHGLHVLVEKPIDISTARADALIAAAERAGVKLAVFFQDRFKPDLVRLKEMLTAGAPLRGLLPRLARCRFHPLTAELRRASLLRNVTAVSLTETPQEGVCEW